jgi:sterol desaturase/sphingolipid hydroxylase (fatty acid hydroxylase superfamily)
VFTGEIRYLVVTAVVLLIAITVELIVPLERIAWRSRARGGLFMATIIITSPLVAYALGGLWKALGIPPVLPPLREWAGWWGGLMVALVARDFLAYWEHRFEHQFFWSVHRVHHAPHDLHAMTNYGHPLHALPLFFLVVLPLSLLNFDSVGPPLFVSMITGLVVAMSHSPVDFHLGPLRRLLIDNRFHRIHHSLEARHFDKNFGAVFPWWDMLFGTAYFPKRGEWPKVGVHGIREPETLGQFLAIPFRSGEPVEADDSTIHKAASRRENVNLVDC